MEEFLSVWEKGSVRMSKICKIMENITGIQEVKTQRNRERKGEGERQSRKVIASIRNEIQR